MNTRVPIVKSLCNGDCLLIKANIDRRSPEAVSWAVWCSARVSPSTTPAYLSLRLLTAFSLDTGVSVHIFSRQQRKESLLLHHHLQRNMASLGYATYDFCPARPTVSDDTGHRPYGCPHVRLPNPALAHLRWGQELHKNSCGGQTMVWCRQGRLSASGLWHSVQTCLSGARSRHIEWFWFLKRMGYKRSRNAPRGRLSTDIGLCSISCSIESKCVLNGTCDDFLSLDLVTLLLHDQCAPENQSPNL